MTLPSSLAKTYYFYHPKIIVTIISEINRRVTKAGRPTRMMAGGVQADVGRKWNSSYSNRIGEWMHETLRRNNCLMDKNSGKGKTKDGKRNFE